MSKLLKLIFTGLLIIFDFIGVFLLIKSGYENYGIIFITFGLILTVCFILILFTNESEECKYDMVLRNILKTYDSVLIDIEKIPDLDVKNVIKISNFEKLIDAQLELRKPIFYKMSIASCSFVLLDTDVAYVYVLRMRFDSFSPLDDVLNSLEKSSDDIDYSVLENIDKTTIIKLNGKGSYKVSPIKNSDGTLINDDYVSEVNDFLPKLKK